MAATLSRNQSRNYKYPYFDPTTYDWNIDTSQIKHFQFVNYINKSHNRTDTLYLIFDVIPKLNQCHILPFTYSNNLAILNDNSKLSLENLMPQYISSASHLNDVSVSIININKLINQFGKQNFKDINIYNQQLEKLINQIKNKNNNKKSTTVTRKLTRRQIQTQTLSTTIRRPTKNLVGKMISK